MTTPRPCPPSRTKPDVRRWLGAVVLALAACSTDSGGDSDLPSGLEVMENTVDNTIVPDIGRFRGSAEGMQGQVDAFCSAPSVDALGEVQTGWRSLSEAWNAVAPYNLGPLDDDFITPKIIFFESMRQRGTDYTQTVRDEIALGVGGTETLDAAYFEGLTFNKVGLLALEVLAFENATAESLEPSDIVADYEAEPRRCEYLQGIIGRLTTQAVELETEWTDAFAEGEAFRDSMLENTLEDGAQPVVALLIALQDHLLYIKDRKLEGILDAQLSGHFYPNVAATLDALEHLLVQPMPEDAVGILDFMAARGLEADVATVEANLAMAKDAAANEDREALITAIGLLEGNIKREIPDGLGVDLGLNFSDGD
ncbi:MAG: imelysin family protein [Myxococcota bacterium]